MKLKKRFNKIVSWVLCLAMVFNLMPVFPALGAPAAEDYQGHSGIVFGYETVTSEKNDKTLAKVTVYSYNAGYVDSYGIRFKWDTDKLDLASLSTGSYANPTNPASVVNGVKLAPLPQWAFDAAAENELEFAETTTMAKDTGSPFATFELIAGANEGELAIDIQTDEKTKQYGIYDVNDSNAIKFPEGELVPLYSMYFAGKRTSTTISSTTSIPADLDQSAFSLYSAAGNFGDGWACGDGNGNKVNTLDTPIWVSFPQPEAAKYPVSIKITQLTETGAALNGATVEIDGPNFPKETYLTNNAGLLMKNGIVVGDSNDGVLQLEAGTYNYTIIPASTATLGETKGTFVVGNESGTQTKALVCQARQMGTYPFTIKALDGDDNNSALSGVTVNVGGSSAGIAATDSSGVTTVEKEENAAPYKVVLSKTGYVNKAFDVTVDLDGNGTITVSDEDGVVLTQKNGDTAPIVTVTMARQQKLITVPVKDADGNLIPGASVTVTADPNGSTQPPASLKLPLTFKDESDGTADGKVILNLPNGDYIININAPGYETSAGIELGVEESQVTLGNNPPVNLDSDKAGEVTVPDDNNLVAIQGPLYIVKGVWDNDTAPTQMTVTVELQNIVATHGTFGLRYDTRIFDFGSFQINNGLDGGLVDISNELIANAGGKLNNPDADATFGTHLFSWKGLEKGADGSTAVDAMTNKVLIGTYTLNVKNNADGTGKLSLDEINALLNNESLFVVPIEETGYKTWADKEYAWDLTLAEEFLVNFWRTVNADNQPDGLKEGRLPEDMATGRIGAKGFYQAFPVKNTGDTDGSVKAFGYDVRTQIEFPNPENNQRVEFIVTDHASGDPIPGATVKVYKSTAASADTATDDELLMTLTADARGEAYFSADQDTTYKYIVEMNGYWPYPGDTDPSKSNDLQTLTVAQDTVREEIELKAKIYHPVDIFIGTTADPDVEAPEEDQNAIISGGDKAYNGLDYSFNIEPKPGQEWAKEKPKELPVIIKGGNEDGTDKEITATLNEDKNIYEIPGNLITGDPLNPEEDPLKAGDLIIKITADYFQDAQYTIKATVEGEGRITAPANTVDGVTVTDDKHVTQVVGGDKTNSDKFVFTGNTHADATNYHYGVAKVVINGVDVSLGNDKGKETYEYTFENVSADQTITVIFGEFTNDEPMEEVDPKYDPVVTIIGSEFGKIIHGSDEATKGDRFDYTLTKTGDSYGTFDVTITPNTGYAVDKIVVDGNVITIDGADKTLDGVTATATSTATGGAQNDQVTGATLTLKDFADTKNHSITATFKKIDGPSIQAIVTSKIKSGIGTVVPFGVSVYNLGDTPSYTMTAADKHQLGEVLFNDAKVNKDTDMTEAGGTYTYKLPALTKDSVLEVTFDEQAFTVKMKVQFYLGNDPKNAINPATHADVTFVRQGDKVVYSFETKNTNNGIADVDANVPVGTWDITVSKYGFLNYIITDYVVSEADVKDGEIKFGLKDDDVTVKNIELTVGEANRNGKLIALDDLAQVANGLLPGAGTKAKEWADVDESTDTKVEDIRYVKKYFGKAYTKETYTDFMAK